jgi:NADPH-dependent 2,4-dienoyl-CoA reductase/sulfur reductase-like enzyme/nitrite reductase/ring-hydroxylating ferredoxin subunit
MAMAQDQAKPTGPDLSRGVPLADLSDGGMLAGHVGEDEVLLVRRADTVFALDAHCTHYHGPLVDGLVVGDTVRCPWHHACFDLATGEAVRSPAFSPLGCWNVERRDGKVFVTGKKTAAARVRPAGRAADAPRRIVIVGGGAAGFAAAEMLRREGYDGSIAMLSDDDAAPVDRPNLSKDYLAGNAPEDWVPLRPDAWYGENHLDLRLRTGVTGIDLAAREVALNDGARVPYDRLLLATGAEPVRLPVPGADQPHVHVLRSLTDCRAIIKAAEGARRVAVVGASFIGLEVAASLRARKLDVHVLAPEKRPLERVFGPELGDFVRALHEQNGVVFHLEDIATAIGPKDVTLKSGSSINADLVVVGIGVRPRVALAEQAGLALDHGVAVNEYLETSAPDIFAAGDIARWPDPASGERIRVEHWVVATRQGQAAARNMLGARARYTDVPFFWSQHYDVPINYVGHAEQWDAIEIDGDIAGKDCLLRYKRGGRTQAVASIYRDVASLEAEVAMERREAA